MGRGNALAHWLALFALTGVARAQSVAKVTGVKENKDNDLNALWSALGLQTGIFLGLWVVFACVRRRFPNFYAYNEEIGTAPVGRLKGGFLSWLVAGWTVTTEEAWQAGGLDSALLVEFCDFAMRLSLYLSIPLVLILCPMHIWAGGGAAGNDELSRTDMGNVRTAGGWVYYVHAVTTWYVCLATRRLCNRTQEKFIKLRFVWLKSLPVTRAHTRLVQFIPEQYRWDPSIKEFFSKIFTPESVVDAHIVKDTRELMQLITRRDKTRQRFQKARDKLQRTGKRPQTREWMCGGKVDAIEYYGARLEALKGQIRTERERVLKDAAASPGGVNTHSAFITFKTRREAEMAQDLRYSVTAFQWVLTLPPEASDVRWQDLIWKQGESWGSTLVGVALLVGIFLAFIPLVTFITTLATSVQTLGPLQPIWRGLAPTLGLQIVMALLPTIVLLIFRRFFILNADAWAQQRLQVWYFAFQMVFVILVTMVGSSLADSLAELSQDPLSIFSLLAARLPIATHFYQNYLILQWTTNSLSLLQLNRVWKKVWYRIIHKDPRRCRPEEGGSNSGNGARYTRLSTLLVICIVYSTLSPLVAPIALVTFAICRAVYGYLVAFAEPRKADLGGAFLVTALHHVQFGAIIYSALMIGLLVGRARPDYIPVIIAAPTLPIMVLSYIFSTQAIDWQTLPFDEIIKVEESENIDTVLSRAGNSYIQSELLDNDEGEGEDEKEGSAQGWNIAKRDRERAGPHV